MKRSFDWTHLRMELISELLDALSELMQEWNTFISRDSDVDYFSDLDEFPCDSLKSDHRARAVSSFRNIKETFGGLQSHQQKLQSLTDSLSRDLKAVRERVSFFGLFDITRTPS